MCLRDLSLMNSILILRRPVFCDQVHIHNHPSANQTFNERSDTRHYLVTAVLVTVILIAVTRLLLETSSENTTFMRWRTASSVKVVRSRTLA